MANFFFYRYHFVQTGDKNLFSKEDNEKVTGEYLNMKFADDLRGKSSAGNHGINLYGFKPDRSGVESSESYVNEIRRFADGVVMLQCVTISERSLCRWIRWKLRRSDIIRIAG